MEPLAGDDPRVLGGYRLLGRLGAGGMGRVYLGRSAGGRTVAVKAVHAHFAADDQFRARFRREIESARRVGGAWTAPVLDADPDAPVPWIATGYVAGPSLAQAVTDAGPLGERSVWVLGAGLAEALAAVHGLGLVHRDVKPSNVLLTLDGPLLIDFGIARATEGTASLTSTGVSVGSPGYMAPEQIVGKGAAGAADVFSLGAVLAFAATGVSPFSGDSSAALLYKVVHEEPELGPQLDGELKELVAGCLAKDPGERPRPEALAARLAGEGSGGAAGLVRAGWLPGPLVERVSRQAVELLNLDVGEGASDLDAGEGASADTGSGTGTGTGTGTVAGVPAADAGVVGGGAGAPGGGAGASLGGAGQPQGGVFGPPDPSYGVPGPSYGAVGGGPAGAGVASGLVPFDAQAQGPGAAGEGGTGAVGTGAGVAGAPGVFGVPGVSGAFGVSGVDAQPPAQPPVPLAGQPPVPLAGHPSAQPSGQLPGQPSGPPSIQPPGPPPQPTPWPVAGAAGAAPHPPTAPGIADLPTGTASTAAPKERRIALSGAVGGKDRPRRVSCTLVLSVAGALAAVTTAAFVFNLMPGVGGGADGGAQTGARPPADRSPTAGPSDPGGYNGGPTVAKAFLGTWTGNITTAHGIPNGTMTSTIKAGGKGDYVIHTTYDAVLVRCEAKAKLESATDHKLVLIERPDGKQGPGCTGNKSRVTYTLRKGGGTIAFASDDPAGGTPKATLSRR